MYLTFPFWVEITGVPDLRGRGYPRSARWCSLLSFTLYFQHILNGGDANLSCVTQHCFTAVIYHVNPINEICQQEAKPADTLETALFSSFNSQHFQFSNTGPHIGVVNKVVLGFLGFFEVQHSEGSVFVQRGILPLFCCAWFMVDFASQVPLGLERHVVKMHEESSLLGQVRNKRVLQLLMLVPTLTVKSVWLFHNLKVIKIK